MRTADAMFWLPLWAHYSYRAFYRRNTPWMLITGYYRGGDVITKRGLSPQLTFVLNSSLLTSVSVYIISKCVFGRLEETNIKNTSK